MVTRRATSMGRLTGRSRAVGLAFGRDSFYCDWNALFASTHREIPYRSGQLILALGLAFVGWIPEAKAATGFDLPSQCGSREQFEQAIRARLGEQAPLLMQRVALSIVPLAANYRLTLRVGADTRRLEDASCTDLFHAAVVIAIALWEAPHAAEPQPAALPADNDGATSVPAATHPAEPSVARRFKGWSVNGEIGAQTGLQPTWGPLFGLRAARDWRDWGLSMRLRAQPSSTKEDQEQHGLSVTGFGGDASVFLKPIDAVMVELGVSLFALRATGRGSRSNLTTTRLSFGPRLGVGVIPWRSGGFFVVTGVEAQLPWLRPRFEIIEYGEVFQVGRLAGAAHLGAGFRFR